MHGFFDFMKVSAWINCKVVCYIVVVLPQKELQ